MLRCWTGQCTTQTTTDDCPPLGGNGGQQGTRGKPTDRVDPRLRQPDAFSSCLFVLFIKFFSSQCTTSNANTLFRFAVPVGHIRHVPLGSPLNFNPSRLSFATPKNMSSTSTSGLSASVTRILSFTGFAKELKTKDIQAAFSEWESVGGGFKIKWKDDTSLLIVFQDASVGASSYAHRPRAQAFSPTFSRPFIYIAKRAYLHALAFPPAILATSPTAAIKPYDGPDAQSVIQTVNSRGQHNSNPSRGHNMRAASISVFPSRSANNSQNGNALRNGNPHVLNTTISEHSPKINGREPSPTLPSLPAHPSLNDLINSAVSHEDPAILHAEGPPKIGDPGKRMLGAALGVRHPALGPRVINGNSPRGASPISAPRAPLDSTMRDVQRAMGSLVVE